MRLQIPIDIIFMNFATAYVAFFNGNKITADLYAVF